MFSHILIVEDESETSAWLKSLMEEMCPQAKIATACTQSQALTRLKGGRFDLMLLDLYLPDGDGETILKRIQHLSDVMPKIIVTSFESRPSRLRSALNAGIDGFVLKEHAREELPMALAALARGEAMVSQRIARTLLDLLSTPDAEQSAVGEKSDDERARQRLTELTERERDILIESAFGLSRSAIAEKLGISAHTVATHLRSIYRKLGVASRAEIAVLASEAGLLDI